MQDDWYSQLKEYFAEISWDCPLVAATRLPKGAQMIFDDSIFARYQPGDEVLLDRVSRSKVLEVVPQNMWAPCQRYIIELMTTYVGKVEVLENRLSPAPYVSRCECGSDKVYGLANAHSYWCPAYVKP